MGDLAITPADGGKLLGTICLWNLELDRAKVEIGYDLMPCHQRKGIMNEAMKAVMGYAYQGLGVCTIEACQNRNNTRSIKLLEGNGFNLSQGATTGASANHDAPDMVYIHWTMVNDRIEC